MAQSDFTNAFNDCIDRLNAGQSLAACLQAYPQYAADLRSLLEAGAQVRRVQADPHMVILAQRRGRERVLAAYDRAAAPQRRYAPRPARPSWALATAAALVIVLALVIFANRPLQDVVPLDQPTGSVTPTLTETATMTVTLTETTTPTTTETPTETATPTFTAAPTDPAACEPAVPDGWVTYRVQSGDTLSLLAAATGTTVEEVMRVNCIEEAGLIVVGQQLFLPVSPDLPGGETPPGGGEENNNEGGFGGDVPGGSGDDNTNENNGSSGGEDDNSNDNDNENDNGNDNEEEDEPEEEDD